MLRANDQLKDLLKNYTAEHADALPSLEQSKELGTAIADGEQTILPVPHLLLSSDESGEIKIDFIDGYDRFAALYVNFENIPVLLETNSFIPPLINPKFSDLLDKLPQELKEQLDGEEEGYVLSQDDDEITKAKKQWAAENKDMLLNLYKAKYGSHVGQKVYGYYAEHGRMPQKDTIKGWIKRAEAVGLNTSPDLEAQRWLRVEDLKRQFGEMLGTGPATEYCVDLFLKTGKPIDREVIVFLKERQQNAEATFDPTPPATEIGTPSMFQRLGKRDGWENAL